jgi:tetratricopeptide (TPR) repeat protein
MVQDWLGNPVTCDPATIGGIDAFVEGFLAYETRAAQIVPTADADPGCALAQAYAAMAHLFLEDREGRKQAARYLARADATAGDATERERMVLAAVRAWADGDMPRALLLGEEIAARYPRELAIAKATQYHYFNLGDAPGLLRIAEKVLPANRDLAYAHGLIAFAYEQCHRLEEAEAAARTAIALKRKEPWAHHAIAHVMLTQGRIDEGRAFMESMRPTWTDLNSFMFTHNWWHLALFMIEQGEGVRVLDFYATHIWGIWKAYSQDQVGAVSLLARLELAGVDVGDRWQDLGEHLAARVGEHVQPFLDLHYLYGLGRAGRPEADAMLASMRDYARTAPAFVRASWTEVAVPAAEGMLAHARGNHEGAVRALVPVLPRMAEIGGSHAQRDFFEQIADDALHRSGRLRSARRRIADRAAGAPRTAPAHARLAEIERALGLMPASV